MFCSSCGKTIEEGSTFCKECGTPAPGHAQSPRPAPGYVPPPPPSSSPGYVLATPPPPPPPGYGPGWQAPPPRRRTGLIVGIIVAAVVVLAGAGVGAYLGLRGGDSDKTAASSTTVSSGSTSTSALDVSTTVTIPDISSSTTESNVSTTTEASTTSTTTELTTTTASSGEAYLRAVDKIVAILEQDDLRIPVLATKINNTAPNVPTSVDNELETMLGTLDGAFTALSEQSPPDGFGVADGYLQDAANAMGNRIDATINGVQAMRSAHKVSAGNTYFDLGRQARDDYNGAYKQLQDSYPVE